MSPFVMMVLFCLFFLLPIIAMCLGATKETARLPASSASVADETRAHWRWRIEQEMRERDARNGRL